METSSSTRRGGSAAQRGRVRSRSRRTAAIVFTAGLSLGAGIATASATTSASGQVGYYTVDGIGYANQSFVEAPLNGYDAYAYTGVWTTGGENVASGWMGVLPRLYQADGALCAQNSGYSYNSGAASGIYIGKYGSCGTAYAYYSYGVTESWNGNGYSAFFSFRSPNVNS